MWRRALTVLILDAYNLLFRAFTSLPAAITAGDGAPINAVYGMLAYILRLLREEQPSHIVAAFDEPEVPTFRHELYPLYQGHRGPLGGENAHDFMRQVDIARQILPLIGIPALSHTGFEADDVMGTVAVHLSRARYRVILVSTDRDLLQLIRPGIEILVPGKEQRRIADIQNVRERIGVDPAAVTTYKALAGDASDHIPGLPGIGTKTAVALIDQFGDLESMYARLEEMPARIQSILGAGRNEAELFRHIATIVCDVPVPIEPLPSLDLTADDRPRSILNRLGYGEEQTESLPAD